MLQQALIFATTFEPICPFRCQLEPVEIHWEWISLPLRQRSFGRLRASADFFVRVAGVVFSRMAPHHSPLAKLSSYRYDFFCRLDQVDQAPGRFSLRCTIIDCVAAEVPEREQGDVMGQVWTCHFVSAAKSLSAILGLGAMLAVGNSFADDQKTASDDHEKHERAEEKKRQSDERKATLNSQYFEDLRLGKIKVEGDHAAVSELILKRDIPIPYDYVATLMRTPNAFGPGPACVLCHGSSDPATSYRGLNLSTCEGILAGSTEDPPRKLFTPGKSAKKEVIGRRLRNNRMPFSISFTVPNDSPAILAIRDWIAAGAKNDKEFKTKILPLFKKAGTFGPKTPACVECHMSNQEPPSFHELNLGTYEGIMLGADSVAKGVANATKVVIPGKPEESGLFQHLAEDRMPPGISPSEDRDHPNTQILLRWIEQGARCN